MCTLSETLLWVEQLETQGQLFVHRVVGSQTRRGSDNFCACFTNPFVVWGNGYGGEIRRKYIEAVTTHNVLSGIGWVYSARLATPAYDLTVVFCVTASRERGQT